MQRYYKITDPAAVAAMEQYEAKKAALCTAASAFASHFGGTAAFRNASYSFSFAGVAFSPPKPTDLWQHPDDRNAYIQRPRARLKSPINKDLKEPHKALLAEWGAKTAECFVDGKTVDRGEANKAIGYNDGMAILCGDSFLAFVHDGAVWVTTRLDIRSDAEEITGGQFEAVRLAAESDLSLKAA
ncbi:hypothetical protein [Vogesella sp. XCS3]|uniref:hypothetical protein n=1 Tax=Vogesella sp. XCS3 TaxID=2877939 RepID=UPI001D0AC862|nr:hypothetical protein [Vogesella sp. XCS3]UDM17885.1 hypothetical protein LCH97_04260 [Vogesella sp. XCS3]